MAGYQPLKITGMQTGLVQEREEFLLPNDAYPVLENAFVWRERIKRKQGCKLLGRLRRIFTAQALGNTDGAGNFTGNLKVIFSLESGSDIQVGSIVISDGVNTFTDNSLGVLVGVPAGTGTINYATGAITITGGAAAAPLTISFNYFPSIPVMGLRQRELNGINNEQLVAFDQTYAYIFGSTGWQEFIPGTTWTGNNSDFFWSTNYWVGDGDQKIFWVTNFSGIAGDPIRYTNGTAWIDFAPTINASGDLLTQCLALLPFRGRLLAFNTLEGVNLATSVAYFQRIRWSAIGTPFSDVSAIVTTVNPNAWRDDIRGQGGFLDIPTSENIVAVGFVRDNLVIYCESSTWQLRYTGRSIAPFQIEKVNTELGAESTFSAVQFDTSLVGIGDKGIVECDSYKSERIDIKIPDLVFGFDNENNGPKRIHGIRDFQQRLAFWTYPFISEGDNEGVPIIFPNRRLVFNYENDSWAIFTDSLTTLGTYQQQSGRTWASSTIPWSSANFSWIARPALFPDIVGGNQQGYVELLDEQVTNDVSLRITNIIGNTTTVTQINSPNHNLVSNQIIKITGIPAGSDFDDLNDGIFSVDLIDANSFYIYKYDTQTQAFITPQINPSGTYIGGSQIRIRDNFSITSKKFNFLDQGNQIQLGFIDVLMNSTTNGAITLNVYLNYNDSTPSNTLNENEIPNTIPPVPDTFFNNVVPTSQNSLNPVVGSKNYQRVFCPTVAQFLTIEWTLSNLQMIGIEQESDVQIDAQILWIRKAGRII